MHKPNRAFARIASVLFALCFSSMANAYVNPPIFTPEQPAAGELVSMAVTFGDCDIYGEYPLDPTAFPRVERNGNTIRVTLYGYQYDDLILCTMPETTRVIQLGAYEAGTYTVQLVRTHETEVGFVYSDILQSVIAVGAGVSEATPLPAVGSMAIIVLIVILGVLGLRARAKCKYQFLILPLCIMMAAASIATDAAAADNIALKQVNVLLSQAPGAPTADEVIDFLENGGGSEPPLQSLLVGSPVGAHYLLPFRASGDFKRMLEEKPDSPRAWLERFIVIQYSADTNLENVVNALRVDEFVVSATLPEIDSDTDPFSINASAYMATVPMGTPLAQYGRQQINSDLGWARAGGHSLVGIVDTGIYTNHLSLRQFSLSGTYVGGNFVPAASWDVGISGVNNDPDVDERPPVNFPPASECYNGGAPLLPQNAGHGTHVAGLIAANSIIPGGLLGTCKNCGIAVAKIVWPICTGTNTVRNATAPNQTSVAVTHLVDNGVQVVNLSFGSFASADDVCAAPPPSLGPLCTALLYARYTDTVVVASSGNFRTKIFFPASDPWSIAVGGIDSSNQFWDYSPGSYSNCPNGTTDEQCGSNYTTSPGTTQKQQELVTAADAVLSLTYPGVDWAPSFGCGDGFPGPGWGNGKGLCTGTSMSAPHVSGLVGLLRSINPLVTTSRPVPLFLERPGLRTVLATTTFEAQASIPVSPQRGYGVPDSEVAAKRFLGIVKGQYIKNRLTPLFSLYSATNLDYAYTTFPQTAVALIRGKLDNGSYPAPAHVSYAPVGPDVPDPTHPYGTYKFPVEYDLDPLTRIKAQAEAYIFTTEFKPKSNWPDLIPVYLVDRVYSGGRDFMLVTSASEIEQAVAQGYVLRNIQGYIADCEVREANNPCKQMQQLYRACKPSINDCAHFLQSNKVAYEAAGYTQPWLAGGSKIIGYAYGSTDTDGDGLPDGFERVVGTNPNAQYSDGDANIDSQEFPMLYLPYSDPCSLPSTCP